MRAPGEPYDEVLRPLYDAARAALPAGTAWFDAHTHIGDQDPDGVTGTPEELVAGLDRAGHDRALLFPMHEPAGYGPANDRVLAVAAASGGRLVALARVAPNAPGALEEARRCLRAGARGIKLHPRSDGFGLPHPVVAELVALAARERGIVLFHAGRGIPRLGEAAVELARAHPDARLVLAHAGISDLGWIAAPAAALPNLLFDTAWWQVWDVLQLFAQVPPGQVLYASDMPYGTGLVNGTIFLRCALAVGHAGEALAAMAGGQLARIVAGEELLDLGPAPGPARLGERSLQHERVVAYLTAAAQVAFAQADPAEPLALARMACQGDGSDPVLAAVDGLVARAEAERAASEGGAVPDDGDVMRRAARSGWFAMAGAQLVGGTPRVPLPAL